MMQDAIQVDLSGRTAYVTGGSRGIAAAIATALARNGARVAFNFSPEADAAAGKATLVGLLGIQQAREHLDRSIATAIAALSSFGANAEPLIEAARHMGRRES